MPFPRFTEDPYLKPIDKDGYVWAAFKEIGLPNNTSIEYELSAWANSVFACINPDKTFPGYHDLHKQTIGGTTHTFDAFPTEDGAVEGEMKMSSFSSPSNLGCGGDREIVLISVGFRKVELLDMTHGIMYSFPGSFEVVYYKLS